MQVRRVIAVTLIAAGSAVAGYGMLRLPLLGNMFAPLEDMTLDWRTRNVGLKRQQTGEADSSQIRLVLFDSTSVQEWPYLVPFPRTVLADLVDAVSRAGAKVIGLDVYLARRYPELDALGKGDERLHDAMQRAGNVVLVEPTEDAGGKRVARPPDPYFAGAAAAVGTADLPTPFETVRETYLTVRTDSGLVPGWAFAIYARALGLNADSMARAAEKTGRLNIPKLPSKYAKIDAATGAHVLPILFVGPPSRTDAEDGAFRAMSAAGLLMLKNADPTVLASMFKDKIVLMGTGFHDSDRFRSPFYDARPANGHDIYGWTYGVEIHANALENLLTGRHPVPLSATTTALLLFLAALLVAAVTFGLGVGLGAAGLVALFAALVWVAWARFDASYAQVPIVSPTLAMLFSFLASTSYISVVEGKDKRMLKGAFGKYVSPAIVDQIIADPAGLKLGGERRTITILFSDLAGFTSLSEVMDPQALVSLLNEYLDDMSDIVFEEGGTLDKYIGDAIMAFYGAPTFEPDHALRACRTVLRMQQRLKELNVAWKEKGLPSLKMRIGVNTGTPVVGNIGGQRRFDYTALGDPVNLAARLEPACKTYGISIMVAEETRRAAGDGIQVRELELLAVVGKAQPVAVYELLGLAGEDLGEKNEMIENYNRGLHAYRNRDFELALQYFMAALELDPRDGPSQLYVERCREYITDPPSADWDFVERRQVK
jgi:adenylate cyclase